MERCLWHDRIHVGICVHADQFEIGGQVFQKYNQEGLIVHQKNQN